VEIFLQYKLVIISY